MDWIAAAERVLPHIVIAAEGEVGRRARVLVWLTGLIVGLLGLAGTLSTLARGPNILGNILLLSVALSAATLLVLRLPLRPQQRVDLGTTWLLLVVFFGASLVAWFGYGPMSPVVAAFGLFPVAGLVLGGPRLGVGITTVCVAQIAALVIAEQSGHAFPLDSTEPHLVWMVATVHAVSLPVLYGFLRAYQLAWRRAADQAAQHADEVQRAADAQGQFLGRMSHELRTPLNAILGYTELVLEEALPGQVEDLERVHRAGSHLLQLVDEILNLEKIGSGQLELRPEVVPLAELVQEVLDEARPGAESAVVLRHDVDEAWLLEVDPLRVRQVLINLVGNACKFTSEGAIVVSTREADGFVHVEVCDSGVGMTAEELQRVFEPFQQGAAGAHHGTGLGLAISRRLAGWMGGTLNARSETGRGTTFCLSLPVDVVRRRPAGPRG